jgi:phenylpyruvate tautomerase PptA (4-oxalocrotonate tautomerase family)
MRSSSRVACLGSRRRLNEPDNVAVGVLDREKQLGVVKELTDIVAAAAGDATLTERTWVLIVESPDGGWGIGGVANTNADIAQAARRALGR